MMATLPADKSAIWEAEQEAEIRRMFPQFDQLLARLPLSEDQTRVLMESALKFVQNKRPEAEEMLKNGLGSLGMVAYKMLVVAAHQRSAAFRQENKLILN